MSVIGHRGALKGGLLLPQDVFASGSIPLDRNSPTPLWAQLEKELRRRLENGDFDQRFPTDRELMHVYAVSRHTARHAIGQLGADGIVRRARGVGTSLDRPTLTRSLGSLYSLRQVIEEDGVSEQCTVLAHELVTNPDVAHHLGLEANTQFVYLYRLRVVGGSPIALDQTWIPAAVGAPLLGVDFTSTSLYDEIERSVGRRPNSGYERITAVVPTPEQRRQLDADGQGLFCVERLGRFEGEPIEWRRTVIRGDRLALVTDWSAGQRLDQRVELTTPTP